MKGQVFLGLIFRNRYSLSHYPENKNSDERTSMAGEPRRAGDSRNSQVIHLLEELGDRLVRSEKERFTVRVELADAREALSQLENRAEQTERIFLTIQDRINKQESVETRLLKRQEELERLTLENAARLERTEALTSKIEEAIILQNRLARRLERTAQDKARILSKIERIEASIEDAREVFGANAVTRSSTVIPQPANNDTPPTAEIWWTKPLRTQVALIASVLTGGALMILAVSQLVAHWPQSAIVPGDAPVVVAAQENSPPTPPQDISESTDATELAAYNGGSTMGDTSALARQMDADPDAVAAALNRIEPSVSGAVAEADKGSDAGTEDVSAPSAAEAILDPQPVSFAPQTVTQEPAQLSDVDAFVSAAIDSRRSLKERINPDAALPAVIKQVEAKAFEGVPEAQHDLAAIYTAGHGGVTVDYSKAALWFQEAAVNGIANARYNLGVLYHQGLGVERDVNKAINWYRAAAALGHPEAQYNLGIAYIEGIGTQYNPRVAADYFQTAAQGGVTEAAYNLGLIHENGLLGDPDMNEAVFWYKLSSDYNPEARVAFDQIVKAMTLKPADISRIVKEYGAVYGFDANGQPLPQKKSAVEKKSTPTTIATATAQPLRTADQAMPAAPLTLNDIPPLTPEETKSLLGVTKGQALVAQVQEQLVRMGLYPGPADGFSGPQTEDAVRTYQARNKLPVTGKVSEDLLVHMLATELNAAAGMTE